MAEDGTAGTEGSCSAAGGTSCGESSCDVAVKDPAELTPEIFFSEHVKPRRPVILRGAANAFWPQAIQNWTLEYLVEKAGDAQLPASTIPYSQSFGRDEEVRHVDLASYIEKELAQGGVKSSQTQLPYYIFQPHKTFTSSYPQGADKLWQLVDKSFGTPPAKMFGSSAENVTFSGGNTQFGLGPLGSGSSPHYHTHAYNLVILGKKKWYLYPPPHQAMSRAHPTHLAEHPAAGPAPLSCEQSAGDVMYIPMDWGHAIVNLETTAGIAREFFDKAHEPPFGELLNIMILS